MTPLVFLLALGQAGLLLWSAVLLGSVALKRRPAVSFAAGTALLVAGIALYRYSGSFDPLRMLCGTSDCIVLVLSVAGIRAFVVTKEEERLIAEHALAVRTAAEAAERARREMEEERVRAAAAALEAHKARLAERQSQPQAPARHLATPLLRGGARSPRFPTPPKT